jgi:hypothetical protein
LIAVGPPRLYTGSECLTSTTEILPPHVTLMRQANHGKTQETLGLRFNSRDGTNANQKSHKALFLLCKITASSPCHKYILSEKGAQRVQWANNGAELHGAGREGGGRSYIVSCVTFPLELEALFWTCLSRERGLSGQLKTELLSDIY